MAVTTNVPSDNFDDWRRDGQDLTKFVNQNSGTVQTRTGDNLTPLPVRDQQFAEKISSLGFVRLEGVTFKTGATVPDNKSLLLWATADGGTGFYYYFSGEIPSGGKIVPPDSTPASTGGTGQGGWLVIDDLEQRLADIKSAVLIANVEARKVIPQGGFVNLEWFDENLVYNGVYDCYPAYVAAKAAVGTGRIVIAGKAGDVCHFATYPNEAEILVGPLFDVSEGVRLKITQAAGLTPMYGNSTIRVVRNTEIYEATTDTYIYASPQINNRIEQRNITLNANDADMTKVTAYDMVSEVTAKKLNWDGLGDTFDADVYSATTASSAQLNTAHDGYVHLGMVRLSAGESVSCAFSDFNNTDTAVMCVVSCAGGYYGLYGSNNNAVLTSFAKPISGARTTAALDTEMTGYSQYRLPVSNVTIKVIDNRHFAICVNGVDVHNVITTSDILEVGIGAYDLGSTATVLTMNDFIKIKSAPIVSGHKSLTLAVFGDSISAGSGVQHVYASWPEQVKQVLDGVGGIRVKSVLNYAVSGATSGTQAPLVTSGNIATADYVLFLLGTNDVQGGVALATYLSNMTTMINTCLSNNKRVIVGIPPMFYTQSDALGVTGKTSGNATTNTAAGAVYRSGLIRLCATLGVKVVDTLGGSGAVIAPMLDRATYLDSTVTDNIHPTVFGRTQLACQFAKAIIGYITDDGNKRVTGALPTSGLLSGSTFVTEPAQYSLHGGAVQITGVIDVQASLTDGTVIYKLPINLRPSVPQRFVVFDGTTSFSILAVAPNGDVLVYSSPNTATFISMQMRYDV